MLIIGIDSAVQAKNNGLTLGSYNNKSFTIIDKWNRTALKNTLENSLLETLHRWIVKEKQVLLCIDSPLGWPFLFGKALAKHKAGEFINIDDNLTMQDEMNKFFKRKTDIDIAERYKKTPLEISANLIARTAFSTLKRICILNSMIKPAQAFSLLLNSIPRDSMELKGIIEVYPAVTLLSNNLIIEGYKKKDSVGIRKKLIEELCKIYNIDKTVYEFNFTTIDHDFDSLVCCLTGIDFIEGRCKQPDIVDSELTTEGWIWAKYLHGL